jgi:hypothetical protein
MQDAVEFLKSAAARVRQLAPAAPEIGDRLKGLADELEAEARSIQAGGESGKEETPAR